MAQSVRIIDLMRDGLICQNHTLKYRHGGVHLPSVLGKLRQLNLLGSPMDSKASLGCFMSSKPVRDF